VNGSITKEASRPVIILGAARSGTKLLRSVIASHPGMVAIPHDINFIWKYGNYRVRHDELTPANVTPRSAAFIRRFFERFRQGRADIRVVEKTVSNTIRVDFVRTIFPSCQFIHLVRNGLDVSVSSMFQWQEKLDSGEVLDKLKYFPVRALPTYGVQYALTYLSRTLSGEKRVSSWGVRLKDLDALVRRYSLLEVCGLQWSRCVEHTVNALTAVPETDKLEVHYELFVQKPVEEIERILAFLGLEMSDEVVYYIKDTVRVDQIGKWKSQLQPDALEMLLAQISGTMQQLGVST
jgi:hypothetical protein